MAAPAAADGGDAAAVLPSFPLPPPFFKLFADCAAEPRPEPPPPPSGTFMVFGFPHDPEEPLVPPLQGRRLFEQRADGSIDIKGQLSRLTTEFVFVYSEVLRVLADSPASYTSPLNTLNHILANIQYLINMLRHVQARHTLEYGLSQEILEKEAAIAAMLEQSQAVDAALLDACGELRSRCGGVDPVAAAAADAAMGAQDAQLVTAAAMDEAAGAQEAAPDTMETF